MKRIRVGVVGNGRWGQRILHALCDDLSSRAAVEWVHGRTAAPEGVLDPSLLKRVDAVILATPAPLTPPLAIQVLKAKKPVFLEKPMAMNVFDAEALHAAATRSRLPVLVDHVQLWDPAYRLFKRWVNDEKLESLAVTAKGAGPWRDWGPNSGFWDWGPHVVAWAIDLLGVPDMILVPQVEREDAGGGRLYAADMLFRLYRPRHLKVHFSFGNGAEARERGLFGVSKRGHTAFLSDGTFSHTLAGIQTPAGPQPLTGALTTFLDAIAGKSDARMGTQLGLDVVKTLARLESLLNDTAAGALATKGRADGT